MASNKNCAKCSELNRVIEEQKSKLQLLESRLKDLVRAYKVVCKERDNFQTINATVNNDVDVRQQKRIAELEESVIHMTSLCGKLELGRQQDKEQIRELQEKYENLSQELNNATKVVNNKQQNLVVDTRPKSIELRNICTQTDMEEKILPEMVDRSTQTVEMEPTLDSTKTEPNRTKNETAVVAPLVRDRYRSEGSEMSDPSELMQLPSFDEMEPIGHDRTMVNSSTVSLYHINELARKELELAEYKLRVREHECSLREFQWKYTNEKYRLQSRISDLEQLNRNLMITSSKEPVKNPSSNINVAYIKNVLNKLIETKDKEQRQLMINALITALDSMQTR